MVKTHNNAAQSDEFALGARLLNWLPRRLFARPLYAQDTTVHLVVFDIDGTLVESAEFDGDLYAQAVEEALGFEIDTDWSKYANVTDSGILRELLETQRFMGDRHEAELLVKRTFVRLTKRYLERYQGVFREIRGAKALVEELCSRPSVRVAVATGGWKENAIVKLRSIGINPNDLPLATGSDAETRCEIVQIAERRALGDSTALQKTLFGDGLWDKKAAEELSYAFVAVGNSVQHHASVVDLSDHEWILAQLGV